MTIVWPRKILPPHDPMFHLAPMNISGPVSQDGAADVIASDYGFWRATYGGVVVTTRDRVVTWNAIDAMLEGRLGTILVPYCSSYQPLPVKRSVVPHSDGTTHSDGTGYLSGSVEVWASGAALAGATSITVDVVVADDVQPGMKFSIGERLYRVKSLVGNVLTFRPPLRDPVAAGAELNFDNPVCRMRLATDNEMELSLDGNRRSMPTVNFIEDLLS